MTTTLVIGGTGFVGRHVAAELLEHGHEVTVSSRGTDTGTRRFAADHVRFPHG